MFAASNCSIHRLLTLRSVRGRIISSCFPGLSSKLNCSHMSAPQQSTQSAPSSSTPAMVDESDWQALSSHYATYDANREAIIKRCRDGQKLAKQAIYSLHRTDIEKASSQLKETEAIAAELLPIIKENPMLRLGSYSALIEEYVEAMMFRGYLQEGRLLRSTELPLADPDEYMGGVLDFIGELNRYSVQRGTARDTAAVQKCRDLADAVFGQFLKLDMRNGGLRKKFDSLKYTIAKMEHTLYDLSMCEARGQMNVQPPPTQLDQEGQTAEETMLT